MIWSKLPECYREQDAGRLRRYVDIVDAVVTDLDAAIEGSPRSLTQKATRELLSESDTDMGGSEEEVLRWYRARGQIVHIWRGVRAVSVDGTAVEFDEGVDHTGTAVGRP